MTENEGDERRRSETREMVRIRRVGKRERPGRRRNERRRRRKRYVKRAVRLLIILG
jgi:hypothetical protein